MSNRYRVLYEDDLGDDVLELIPDEDDPNFRSPHLLLGDYATITHPHMTEVSGTVEEVRLGRPQTEPEYQCYRDEDFYGFLPPMWEVRVRVSETRVVGVAPHYIKELVSS